MKKIVELLINIDDFDFEGEVDIISLVDRPAIGIDWLAFSQQEFVTPKSGQSEEEFIPYCISKLVDEGYPQDQAAAICYSTWEDYKMAEEERTTIEETILEMAADLGETLYDDEVVYIDMSKEHFSTLENIVGAISALDILGKMGVKKDEPAQQRYRYSGPKDSKSRKFCQAMLGLNKLYTLEEIRQMEGRITEGLALRAGGRTYSIFEFKGGANCRHSWHSVQIFKDQNNKVVVMDRGAVSQTNTLDDLSAREARNAGTEPRDTPTKGYTPAEWNRRQSNFSIVEEEMMVVGPAMVPQKLILRKDEKGNPFWVYFSKETIKKIAEKFLKNNYLHNTDINHDNEVVTQNTLVETWIVEDPQFDKSKLYGFDVTEGTWMVKYKINNEDTWNKIKAGELRGFSIAGTFLERATKA